MKTHHFLRIPFALLLAVSLAACNDEEDKPSSTHGSDTGQRVTSSTLDQVNHTTLELTKRLEAEQTLRLQAEARLTQETNARSWWQNAASALAVVAVAALVIGSALGSSTRHESDNA